MSGTLPTGQENHPNRILHAKRVARGWSRERAARELSRLGNQRGLATPSVDALQKALYRHETGRSAVKDPLYVELYSVLYEADPEELFGTSSHSISTDRQGLEVTVHRFFPVFLGEEAVQKIDGAPVESWVEHRRAQITTRWGNGELFLYPFGVALLHIMEDCVFPTVASCAIQRRSVHMDFKNHGEEEIQKLLDASPLCSPHVLTAYWLHLTGEMTEADQITGRMLCTPGVLLQHDLSAEGDAEAHAELVERELRRTGYDSEEITSFGIDGTALGYASWAGVVYAPIAPLRALTPTQFTTYECAVQAVWSYCEYIRCEVGEGRELAVNRSHGRRFLRAAQAKLVAPHAHETTQHRSMRRAILSTSALPEHLAYAIDVLS